MSFTTIHRVFLFLCLCVATSAFGQREIKKLPSNINRASINLFAPFISGDGKTILYLSDYTDDGHHGMRWATKKTVSTWNDGQEINKLINRPTLNYRGGYSLSFDGDFMIFTSRKSGLGGFDLWYSKRRGNDWEAPSNFGAPINSNENDGAGMLSPDGEYLYFMRCEQMSEYGGAKGCRLMVSKKNNQGWDNPVELPSNINTGNSQTPRILADGETLVFASDQLGGKGGLDLFMSTKSGDGWTDPRPMDFINTEKDDQFISIPAKGRYLLADIQGSRDRELVEILIPDEFRPKRVMRIQGEVVGADGEPVNADLTVFNVGDRDRLWNEKVGKQGEFAIVLKEGSVYDISIDEPGYLYYSKIYDLTEEVGARDKESIRIALKPIQAGTTFASDILFEEYSAKVSDNSIFEMRRISDLMRKNPSMKIEIEVTQNKYQEDSLRSNADLTELRIDTLLSEQMYEVRHKRVVKIDTTQQEDFEDAEELNEEIKEGDELIADVETEKAEYKIRKIYHNDRTEAQARAVKEYLTGRGIQPDRIITKFRKQSADDLDKPDTSVTVTILSL